MNGSEVCITQPVSSVHIFAFSFCFCTAAMDSANERVIMVFMESFSITCPVLALHSLLSVIDQICSRIVAAPTISTTVPNAYTSDLINLPLIDIAENAYKLCKLSEIALISDSHTSGVPRTSSAYMSLLRSFGLDWRQVWQTRFVPLHLQSVELGAHSPMIRVCLWQLMQRMTAEQQANTITHLCSQQS
jgi:hypothetical protein